MAQNHVWPPSPAAAGHTRQAPATGTTSRLWWKRPFDLLLGGPLLLVLTPVIAFLALLVRADSPGSPFYRQQRIGLDGRPFAMWKLRTMVSDCDADPHRRAAARWFRGGSGEPYKSLADPRITRVGRWLRRTNLDELPQLANVLDGSMSLVGPRPAIPYELEHYEPAYFERLRVPPGVTGPWQVSRRERLSGPQMMELDRRYVRSASPWLDLKILIRTAPALLRGAVRGG